MLTDLVYKGCVTGADQLPPYKNMRRIYMERVQDRRIMGDDDQRGILIFLECTDPLRDSPDCVHVKSGVGLIENGKGWTEEHQLENLRLLLLSSGKAHIQIPFCVGRIHLQDRHCLKHLFSEIPDPHMLPRPLFECRLYKVPERDAGDLQRILEGHIDPALRPLIDSHIKEVSPVKENLASRHFVRRISHDRVS